MDRPVTGAERRGSWREQLAGSRDDRGSTLLEVVVGMSIMLIFLGMFTGAMVMLYQTSNRANALTASAAQTDAAFARMDKSVRYADAISTPGTTATGWYVEFLTTATGVPTCTQLAVGSSGQQLRARTWRVSGAGFTGLSTWTPWADGITNGDAPIGSTAPPVPFVLLVGGADDAFEQLRVRLVATSGSPAEVAGVDATFTALNSATSATEAGASIASASTVCNQVGRP